jgi:hypothetical protein
MGPVEITFLFVILIFTVVGIVRGYHRELGVTVMLLLALLVLMFLETQFPELLKSLLAVLAGSNTTDQATAKAIIYTGFLCAIVFISYQGDTLTFPGGTRSPLMGLGAGLLNGYLFAGSVWYYLAEASWPYLNVTGSFSDLYNAASRLLPPAILDWRYLIVLVAILLIMRVWR